MVRPCSKLESRAPIIERLDFIHLPIMPCGKTILATNKTHLWARPHFPGLTYSNSSGCQGGKETWNHSDSKLQCPAFKSCALFNLGVGVGVGSIIVSV